jgi:hypothetical protein
MQTQDSTSKELHVNSYGDFCLLAPKDPFGYISGGPEVVSWCAKVSAYHRYGHSRRAGS